jgi:nucleoside-diphosphate-sugar epimerase
MFSQAPNDSLTYQQLKTIYRSSFCEGKKSSTETLSLRGILPLTVFPPLVLNSYFQGKKRAEEAVLAAFNNRGFILRPGFIYGIRDVPLPKMPFTASDSTLSVPLNLLGR